MSDGHHTSTVSFIVPLAANEYGVELNDIRRSSDNDSIGSNTSSSHGKHNSVVKRFQKIVNKFDCLNVETRGIERVSPDDRTDSTIINTAMIWVRNLFVPNTAYTKKKKFNQLTTYRRDNLEDITLGEFGDFFWLKKLSFHLAPLSLLWF